MSAWLELSIEVEAELVEAVQEVFQRFNHHGTAIEQYVVFASEDDTLTPDLSRPFLVKTYLPVDEQTEQKKRELHSAVALLSLIRPMQPLRERNLGEEDWQEAWKPFFPVVRIGQRTIIKPSWRRYRLRPGEILIELDPGMAFGTGLHPSTRLCIEELEELVGPGQSVLDLGTGSGILSLVAAKLGASRVLALDIDPVAVRVARANVEANRLKTTIAVAEGTLPQPAGLREGFFDVVVANLTASAIARLAEPLWKSVKPGGKLVAGGIIDERLGQVREALLHEGFALATSRSQEDWRTITAVKRGE